jgi:hypothetical protein
MAVRHTAFCHICIVVSADYHMLCRYEPIKYAMAGLIFDSAPCVMTVTSGRAAISEGTNFPIKQLLQAAFLVITLLTFALVGNTPKRFW